MARSIAKHALSLSFACLFTFCGHNRSHPGFETSTIETHPLLESGPIILGGICRGERLSEGAEEWLRGHIAAREPFITGAYVSDLDPGERDLLETALLDRDIAAYRLELYSIERTRSSDFVYMTARLPRLDKARDKELEVLAKAPVDLLSEAARVWAMALEAQTLALRGRLAVARRVLKNLPYEQGREIGEELLARHNPIDLDWFALQEMHGPRRWQAILDHVPDPEVLWLSLRSIEFYAELLEIERFCMEWQDSSELYVYMDDLSNSWTGWCGEDEEVDVSGRNDLDRSTVSRVRLRNWRPDNPQREVYSFRNWGEKIIAITEEVGSDEGSSLLGYQLYELDPESLEARLVTVDGEGSIRDIAEDDQSLYALLPGLPNYRIAVRKKGETDWSVKDLPFPFLEQNKSINWCRLAAVSGRVLVINHDDIRFRLPDGTWSGIPLTSLFGDRGSGGVMSFEGSLPREIVALEDRLYLGYNMGEFGGGVLEIVLGDNPYRPLVSGRLIERAHVVDLIAEPSGTLLISAGLNHHASQNTKLIRLTDEGAEKILCQRAVGLCDLEHSVCDDETRFFFPVDSRLTSAALDSQGNVHVLFPTLGVVKFSETTVTQVLDMNLDSLETEKGCIYVLPSGNYLLGTERGLFALIGTGKRWKTRRIRLSIEIGTKEAADQD